MLFYISHKTHKFHSFDHKSMIDFKKISVYTATYIYIYIYTCIIDCIALEKSVTSLTATKQAIRCNPYRE